MKHLLRLLFFFLPLLSYGQACVFEPESYQVNPSLIEFVNGKCDVTVTLTIPPKEFGKSAVCEVTPYFRWQGSELKGESVVLQGERGNGFGRIVSYKNGMTLPMTISLPYGSGIETVRLFVDVTHIHSGERGENVTLELPIRVDRSPFLVYETSKDASYYYFRGFTTGNKKADEFVRRSEEAATADDRIKLLTQAMTLVPKNFMIYNNLGLNHLDRGEVDLASSAFVRAFEESNGMNEVAANLCLLTFSQRKPAEAGKYLEKAEGATFYNEAKGNFLVSEGKYGNATAILSNSTSNTSILAHILNQEFLVAGRLLEKKAHKNAMTYYLQAMLGAKSENRMMLESGLRQLRKTDGRLYRAAKASDEFMNYQDLFRKIEQ